jgi:hypothetical protein
MKSGLHTVVDNVAKVIGGIAAIATTRVMVGVPAEKGSRTDGEPINNAALAYIHNNGAPEAGIPAREFMRSGIDAKKAEITAGLEKTGQAALDGKPEAVDRGFHRVGLIGQAALRAKITEGPFTPLKEATIEARRRRGRTGTKPLLDRGELRNALSYVIRKV